MHSSLSRDSLKSGSLKSKSLVLDTPARGPLMRKPFGRSLGLALYILFLMVPVYWLLNMSFKTNADIPAGLSLVPPHPTREN